MNKSTFDAALLSLSLDRALGEPLHGQLAGQLRTLILERRISAGERLPSSRLLASELSVSRVTVTTAIDQLISEGYAEGRHGSGVYVATDLPDYTLPLDQKQRSRLSDAPLPVPQPSKPFETAAPDLEHFPHREWARLLDQCWRTPAPPLLAKADPFGWGPLREAIASHLSDWRGVTCSPAQIVITSGLVEAIDLVSKAVLAPGDTVLVEEPGHHILRRALQLNALNCEASLVDDYGLDIRSHARRVRGARAVVVTPSRQFPLGMTLPLARRLELLEWAKHSNGFVIEDDFDSEIRYEGQPLPALMSLDDQDSVIYVGSFSKVMLPMLRLGFIVLPMRLVKGAMSVMAETGPRASLLAQPALARFMASGGFATHLRRMRRLYARRQRALVSSLQESLGDLLVVEPASGGMHLVADLTPALRKRASDVDLSERARTAGVAIQALSSYYASKPMRQGLVLGYAAYEETAIEEGVGRLAKVIKQRRRQ